MPNYNNNAQFKATKFWNNLVFSFQFAIPCKNHRRRFRQYEDTFPGSDAVTLMRGILMTCRSNVSRKQAMSVLKKFLMLRIIEDVKGRSGTEDFKDDSTLYRLSIEYRPPVYSQNIAISKNLLKPISCKAPGSKMARKRPGSPPQRRRYSVTAP